MALRDSASYDMNLGEFDRYLRDKNKELDRCITEVSEVQERLREEFQRELTVWQGLFGISYPQVTARRAELPAVFQEYLDRIEQEERERLEAEMAELTVQLQSGRKAIDARMATGQRAVQALKKANPELDAREEALKRKIADLQDEYTEAYQELQAARQSFLSFVTHAGQIRRATRRQASIKQEQEKAIEQLRLVRHDWLTAVQETSEKQATLREQWQQATIQTAERQARYDYVRNNLTELARQMGIQRALDEMTEAPPMSDELGATLRELAEHNIIRARYEEALAAVSESLGLLKGINTGMDKFGASVSQVLGEQKRYGLRQITVRVPRQVASVNQTWAALAKEARDEEAVLRAPLEFAAIARRYVIDRLTPEVIQRFFETMGEALNKATQAWN